MSAASVMERHFIEPCHRPSRVLCEACSDCGLERDEYGAVTRRKCEDCPTCDECDMRLALCPPRSGSVCADCLEVER